MPAIPTSLQPTSFIGARRSQPTSLAYAGFDSTLSFTPPPTP